MLVPPRFGWRLCRASHVGLSGEETCESGGRWTSPNTPMLYLAEHPALAVLEVRVHLDCQPEELPDDFVFMRVKLPDGPIRHVEEVPEDCRALGDAWVRDAPTPMLCVPSAVVPQAFNILLNPKHPMAEQASIEGTSPYSFDPRLWKG